MEGGEEGAEEPVGGGRTSALSSRRRRAVGASHIAKAGRIRWVPTTLFGPTTLRKVSHVAIA